MSLWLETTRSGQTVRYELRESKSKTVFGQKLPTVVPVKPDPEVVALFPRPVVFAQKVFVQLLANLPNTIAGAAFAA